jgi:hypothetical protein
MMLLSHVVLHLNSNPLYIYVCRQCSRAFETKMYCYYMLLYYLVTWPQNRGENVDDHICLLEAGMWERRYIMEALLQQACAFVSGLESTHDEGFYTIISLQLVNEIPFQGMGFFLQVWNSRDGGRKRCLRIGIGGTELSICTISTKGLGRPPSWLSAGQSPLFYQNLSKATKLSQLQPKTPVHVNWWQRTGSLYTHASHFIYFTC